jgi:hypothetical protein
MHWLLPIYINNTMSVFKFRFLLLCFVLLACNNHHLIGEWKRELNSIELNDSQFINSGWGNIIFKQDSTFTITGDTNTSVDSLVPGWHMGGPIRGRWRVEENHLLLHTDDLPALFDLRYKIIQLTSNQLVILSAFDNDDTIQSMKYTRK